MLMAPRLSFDMLVQHEEPQNVGLGPAIIERAEVTFYGNVLEPGFGMWESVLPLLELPDGVKSGGMQFGKNQILPPGARETLFRWCATSPRF